MAYVPHPPALAARPRRRALAAAALAVALAATLLAAPPPASAQDPAGAWPQAHGDSGNTRQGVAAGPDDPGVKWLAVAEGLIGDDAPEGYSHFHSLILAPDGAVVLTARASGQTVGQGNIHLIGLDPADGSRKWHLPFVDERCTPAVDSQGRIWVHRSSQADEFDSTTLQAVDPDNGEPYAGSELAGVPQCAGTPMHLGGASDHLAYMVAPGGQLAHTLAVYDVSGDEAVEAWVLDFPEDDTLLIGGGPEPAITFTDTEVVVFQRSEDRADVKLVAYDLATGANNSELVLPLPALDPDEDAPDGDDVGVVRLLKAGPDTLIAAVGRRMSGGNLQAYFAEVNLGGGALTLGWRTDLVREQPTGEFGVQHVDDMALGDGVVVTKLRTGPLTAFRLSDGEKAWDAPALQHDLATDADGAVYINAQADEGGMAATSYSPTGQLRWQAPATRIAEELGLEGDHAWANNPVPGPIAADGTLYLSDTRGSNNKILAVDNSGGLDAGAPALGEPGVARVTTQSGLPRDIAIEICRFLVDDGQAQRVALARDDDFADALAGSALPGVSCILFTPGGPDAALDPQVRAEIDRALAPGGQVFVLGGEQAVSAQAANELTGAGYEVSRLFGPTRYETAETIALRVAALSPTPRDEVLLASGGDWPDAITGGGYAAARSAPVLLTPPPAQTPPEWDLHPATRRAIDQLNPSRTYVVGGVGVVGEAAANATPGPQRVAGTNRMGTAVEVAEQLWVQEPRFARDAFVLANLEHRDGWVLALAAAPLSAQLAAPQLGVRTTNYPLETEQYLEGLGFTELPAAAALGDVEFINDEVLDQIRSSIEPS